MKTIYCTPNFLTPLTTMELDRPMMMSDYLLEQEIKRLLEEVPGQEAIRTAVELLYLGQQSVFKEELPAMIMQTDNIHSLLRETQGMMTEADELMKEEYQDKTYYSFLIELMDWAESE